MILDSFNIVGLTEVKQPRTPMPWFRMGVVALAAISLVACGDKEKKPGQSLASVNGEEITVLQLNEELQRSNVPAGQLEAAKKQLLNSLVDRQLLLNEATKEKLDRDPKVVQSIERARALIIAQAYLQKRIGTPARPNRADVEDYYIKHPQFFQQRKQFDMRQLVIDSANLTPEVKSAIDSAKSLDEVATWLDSHDVKYARAQLTRTSAELPPELSAKLLTMDKGQLFIVKEGVRSLLVSIADIKPVSVTLEAATPQIEQFLINQKSKLDADAELARLRAAAKIVYLNKAVDENVPATQVAPAADASGDANVRGVAGLK